MERKRKRTFTRENRIFSKKQRTFIRKIRTFLRKIRIFLRKIRIFLRKKKTFIRKYAFFLLVFGTMAAACAAYGLSYGILLLGGIPAPAACSAAQSVSGIFGIASYALIAVWEMRNG